MRRLSSLAVLGLALGLSGCYKITVNTGAPAAPQSVQRPWNHGFLFGLVAPAPVNVQGTCSSGVSQVVTQRSFLNGLVGGVTYGIYTPVDIRAQCASGPVQGATGR